MLPARLPAGLGYDDVVDAPGRRVWVWLLLPVKTRRPGVHGFARCTCNAGAKPCTPGEIMYIGATLEEQIAERRPVGGAG